MKTSTPALWRPPCPHCRTNDLSGETARRRVLQILALLEHPGMPSGPALRLGAVLMAMTAAEPQLVCRAVARGDA